MSTRRSFLLVSCLLFGACSNDEPGGAGNSDVPTLDGGQSGDSVAGLDFGDLGSGTDSGASDLPAMDSSADAPTRDGDAPTDGNADVLEDTTGDAAGDGPSIDSGDEDLPFDADLGTCDEPEFSCCAGNLEAEPICIEGRPTCPEGFRRVRPGTCGIIQLRCDIDDCGETRWCDFADNRCLPNDVPISTSMCRERPLDCGDPPSEPVCGCDGVVYDTPCEANLAGVDTWIDGDCDPPSENHFQCGDHFCDGRFQYCRLFGSDIGGFPDLYDCVTVADDQCPEGITCACLEGEICSEICMVDDTDGGGVTLICAGG